VHSFLILHCNWATFNFFCTPPTPSPDFSALSGTKQATSSGTAELFF